MATPKTWTDGEVVDAADMNAEIRDQLLETAPHTVTNFGDLVIGNATGTGLNRVGKGTGGQILTAVSNGVVWADNDPLPAVTAADSGDLLAVDSSGEWSKSAPPVELPAVSGSDNGDHLEVVSGAWAKSADTPELPSVSSSDSGKQLTVNSSGNWAAQSPLFTSRTWTLPGGGQNEYVYDTIYTFTNPGGSLMLAVGIENDSGSFSDGSGIDYRWGTSGSWSGVGVEFEPLNDGTTYGGTAVVSSSSSQLQWRLKYRLSSGTDGLGTMWASICKLA